MAVVLIEGFDHLSAMTLKGWSQNPTTVQPGRFDGQCFRYTNSVNSVTSKTLPSTYSTLFFGFAVRASSPGTGNVAQIRVGASSIMNLNLASSVLAITNSGGTTIATGTTSFIANTWNYVEVKLVINGASGTVTVNLNGVSEIAQTTGNFGSTNADTIAFSGARSASSATIDFDDVYVVDTTGSAPRNTFLGDVRVETIYPNGDGAHTAWTPNTGLTHYTQVNEVPPDGDATYVSDATPGDIDTYTFGDVDTGATVYGVQTNLYARKDDANTRQIAPVIRQAGTDTVGTSVTLTASYICYSQLYNQDPTAADWTPTTVNADEYGVKEIA